MSGCSGRFGPLDRTLITVLQHADSWYTVRSPKSSYDALIPVSEHECLNSDDTTIGDVRRSSGSLAFADIEQEGGYIGIRC